MQQTGVMVAAGQPTTANFQLPVAGASQTVNVTEAASAIQSANADAMGRNSIYGPHFFDVDMPLMKDVKFGEHVTFSFGAQAYNLFNHPNFDQPVADISNTNSFGSSIAAVGPPTSLLGSFVGAGSSPRFLEIKGILRF